jgi:hypothetical protein
MMLLPTCGGRLEDDVRWGMEWKPPLFCSDKVASHVAPSPDSGPRGARSYRLRRGPARHTEHAHPRRARHDVPRRRYRPLPDRWGFGRIPLVSGVGDNTAGRREPDRPSSRRSGSGAHRREICAQPGVDRPWLRLHCRESVLHSLVGGRGDTRLLECLLDTLKCQGLLKAGGRQRTNSTHVLVAVRDLERWRGSATAAFCGGWRRRRAHPSDPPWLDEQRLAGLADQEARKERSYLIADLLIALTSGSTSCTEYL